MPAWRRVTSLSRSTFPPKLSSCLLGEALSSEISSQILSLSCMRVSVWLASINMGFDCHRRLLRGLFRRGFPRLCSESTAASFPLHGWVSALERVASAVSPDGASSPSFNCIIRTCWSIKLLRSSACRCLALSMHAKQSSGLKSQWSTAQDKLIWAAADWCPCCSRSHISMTSSSITSTTSLNALLEASSSDDVPYIRRSSRQQADVTISTSSTALAIPLVSLRSSMLSKCTPLCGFVNKSSIAWLRITFPCSQSSFSLRMFRGRGSVWDA
mmetsp:Transcript_4479/g.17623  ORF Transcript_4479/g.17623 Transcript_4479/m.17623 type:complete len:271 (-) Transcript_4479:2620-3432(-)|eukprot:scaffold34_cov260-Pinguiococcus_pyrenoidosus.AAC.13